VGCCGSWRTRTTGSSSPTRRKTRRRRTRTRGTGRKCENVDEYIAEFPADVQKILTKIRSTIRKSAPKAGEKIAYGIPTFTLNGNLVHFAAFKNHIGFYPDPSGIDAFARELSPYESAKGSVQFPLDQPIPYDLISRIVRFRVQENLGKGGTAEGRKPAARSNRTAKKAG
jgi:uncharacterized protein YdhG (YjbR/CyaY superfamily)